MPPPINLTDYCPIHEDIQKLTDEEVWVLRHLVRLRKKSKTFRIFDVKPLKKQISITRNVGNPIPHLQGLHEKRFLNLTKTKAMTTEKGNTLKHVLQALDSDLTLFDSLKEADPWQARVERYRDELKRRCDQGKAAASTKS